MGSTWNKTARWFRLRWLTQVAEIHCAIKYVLSQSCLLLIFSPSLLHFQKGVTVLYMFIFHWSIWSMWQCYWCLLLTGCPRYVVFDSYVLPLGHWNATSSWWVYMLQSLGNFYSLVFSFQAFHKHWKYARPAKNSNTQWKPVTKNLVFKNFLGLYLPVKPIYTGTCLA